MKESGKKREWVKTAAIIFLSVMLVLTFFSNTIMNYSLPEVATQYVQSGSITAKIRGTGMVESGDPYNVKWELTEERKIASVAVRVGDKVQKGDVLFYLEETENVGLPGALKELEDAQEAYDKAVLEAAKNNIKLPGSASSISWATYINQINAYQNAIKAEQDKVKPIEEQIAQLKQLQADIDAQLGFEQNADSSASDRYQTANEALQLATRNRDQAYTALQDAQSNRGRLETELAAAKQYAATVSGNDAAAAEATIKDLESKLAAAITAESNAQNNYNTEAANYNSALADYNVAKANDEERNTSSVKNNLKDQRAAISIQLYNLQEKDLPAAKAKVQELEGKLTDLTNQISQLEILEPLFDRIAEAQKKVDELQGTVNVVEVTAPINGAVNSIGFKAGDTILKNDILAVMQPEGQGFTLSFSVTNEQARRLNVGDRADLVNAWRYDDVEVVLASIKPDKNNPGQQKQLTFNVTGEVVAGQTLNLSVGQKSANYDYIVPNSAIREDNNGQFILIVESKASPLGTRYTASRVDVQVIASDDTQSAIQGGIYGYEFVITTSTAPVQAGELVRLAE